MPNLWQAISTWNSIVWSIVTFIPSWWRSMQSIEDYARETVRS